MRNVITAIGLALFALFCPRAASAGITPKFVYETAVSSMTLQTVTVSTSAAVQVDSPQLVSRASIEIQNIDPNANLWCGPNNSVAVNAARKIGPGSTWVLGIGDRLWKGDTITAFALYCISDGTASTLAIVSQAY